MHSSGYSKIHQRRNLINKARNISSLPVELFDDKPVVDHFFVVDSAAVAVVAAVVLKTFLLRLEDSMLPQ